VTSHRHLSAISPGRIRRFARKNNMEIELLTGAFFARLGAYRVEDWAPWIRANLMWGALFPSLGSEVYFSLRRDPA
jgi:hypothetical protein